MTKKRITNEQIMEKLNIIEDKQDIASYYGWYFLGIALVIGASTFLYANRLDIALGLYISGIVLIFWGWNTSHKLENKLKNKKKK